MTLALILLLGLLGAPLFAVFGAVALTAYRSAGLDLSLIAAEVARLATLSLLQTLPMFALSGYVLAESRASERLVRLSRAMFGWMPGGLAIMGLVVMSFLTAFTGASGVTIVALGGLLLPALVAESYRERFALGLVTSGGNMGVLFVPSLPLILYGIIANPIAGEVTLDRLFVAGVAPGLLTLVLLSVYSVVEGRRSGVVLLRFSGREVLAALWAARWELPLPFLVLGGVYSGRLAISEVAVITAAYVLIAEVGLYREVRLRQLGTIIRDSMVLVGGILIILGLGMAITNYLVNEEIPARILTAVTSVIHSRVLFLVALNAFLLLVGCVMDIYTAIVVIVPLLVPMALQYGIHPVHLATIFLANLAIGYSTPPVGMNLFIASLRFNRPVMELCRASLPFILILIAALLVITYVPWLSLWAVGPG